MTVSTSIKFYLLAGVIAVIGAVDVFVVHGKKQEKTANQAPVTQPAKDAESTQCFGMQSLKIAYMPVIPSDGNDPTNQFIHDIVRSTFEKAGCKVSEGTAPQVDLVFGGPVAFRTLVTQQHWSETSPYAVVNLKSVGRKPIDQLVSTNEIRIVGKWESPIREHYPGKTLVVSTDPLSDVVSLNQVYSAIIARSADDSRKSTSHKVSDIDIPLAMALNPARVQILGKLNALLASPGYALDFSASKKTITDIEPPTK